MYIICNPFYANNWWCIQTLNDSELVSCQTVDRINHAVKQNIRAKALSPNFALFPSIICCVCLQPCNKTSLRFQIDDESTTQKKTSDYTNLFTSGLGEQKKLRMSNRQLGKTQKRDCGRGVNNKYTSIFTFKKLSFWDVLASLKEIFR